MSNEITNTGNIEDLQWKAYLQSMNEGRKYLRSTWHHTVKPNEANEFKAKTGSAENRTGSNEISSRKNSGIDDTSEIKIKKQKLEKKVNKNKSDHSELKFKLKKEKINSDNELFEKSIETPMDLLNSLTESPKEYLGRITTCLIKKSGNVLSNIANDTPPASHRAQNILKNEVEEFYQFTCKSDPNKKNKKLSIHNSVVPYEIVPYNDKNSFNPFIYTICLTEKIKDSRYSQIQNFVGRYVAVKRHIGYIIGRIESLQKENEIIQLSFFNSKLEESQKCSENLNYRETEIHLLEYMFSYSDDDVNPKCNDFDKKNYFIVASKLNSIFDNCTNDGTDHNEFFTSDNNIAGIYYNGFLVDSNFILENVQKIKSTNLGIIREHEIVDEILSKYFKNLNRNFIHFVDRSEFVEIFTNKLRSIKYCSIELNRITTFSTSYKSYDTLRKYLLHEIVLTMNINHKTERKFGILLAVNAEQESLYLKYYKTGKNQWLMLNDQKLSIKGNIFKGPVDLDSILHLKNTEENFYKYLNFIDINNLKNKNSLFESYDKILLKKYIDGINIMKEMECDKCTYKIGEFEYRLCKGCKKINHIECLIPNERDKENINGKNYWYCKSCKPCRLCFSNINEANTSTKRICSTCYGCYHKECLNNNISAIYPSNANEDKWKCENCLKCLNCGVTAKEINAENAKSKNSFTNNSGNNANNYTNNITINSTNLGNNTNSNTNNLITLPPSIKSKKFSNNLDHCENCEKRYEMKHYCPVCLKLWSMSDANMIECKCKFWVHKECDRIISDDYFRKIKKKNYYCPNCRINKKNKQIGLIVNELIKLDKQGYFYNPVDTVSIKNYTKIIKKPMCYAFVIEKINKNIYLINMDELFADIYLIFHNAMTFNMPNSPLYRIAEQLHINSCQLLEKYYPTLYQMSFEYYLFDYISEENRNGNISSQSSLLKTIEELINNKFGKQVDLLRTKLNQIISKISEYKINWPFLKDFLEKNFNCVNLKDSYHAIISFGNMSNSTSEMINFNNDTYSMASETEKSHVGNIGSILNYGISQVNSFPKLDGISVSVSKLADYRDNFKLADEKGNFNSADNFEIQNSSNREMDVKNNYEKNCDKSYIKTHQNNEDNIDYKNDMNNNYLDINTKENEEMAISIEVPIDYPKKGQNIIQGFSSQTNTNNRNEADVLSEIADVQHAENSLDKGSQDINQNELLNSNIQQGKNLEDVNTNTNRANLIIFNEQQNSMINTDSILLHDFKHKKRQRAKTKIIKSAEFQHELDTYNSNFDLAIKSNNKVSTSSNSNVTHKMEIYENPLETFNPSLALEEEEDTAIKVNEKLKSSDPKLQFLYLTKFKKYLDNFEDQNELSAYLDMIASYVYMKDEKKKKNLLEKEKEKEKTVKLKSEINDYNSEYTDDVYDEPKKISKLLKNKKGRPIKREVESNNESEDNLKKKVPFFINEREGIPNPTYNLADIKFTLNTSNNISTFVNSSNQNPELEENPKIPNSKKFPSTILNKYLSPASSSQIQQENRFKSDSELFEENINSKSLLPIPTQICFTNAHLIFEKNCYLCGSFDDINLFLTCSVCFENFHSYCISNSPLITSNIENVKKYKWKCQNCKFCECCKQTGNDNLLLYCDSCDRALHTYCLDVKLHVVPESGWKCLTCFECANCKTHKYYQNTFPIDHKKDYSIFTRNFSYCFECGMSLFYKSLCIKCGKSDFKNSNKDLIYISNLADFIKNENKLNLGAKTENVSLSENKNIIMLNCNICNNWLHSSCLGFDEINLKFYFEQFDKFNCLDCHIKHKSRDKYLEVTFIKYLEVLKMSYFLMCFNKLINIILKTICKDSNIKLHSKLLKVYLKENFGDLIRDRNMCMLLELIRMDVFLLKDNHTLFDEYPKKANMANGDLSENILKSIKLQENGGEIFPTPIKREKDEIQINDTKISERKEDNFFDNSIISNANNNANTNLPDEIIKNKGKQNLISEESFYGYSLDIKNNNSSADILMNSNCINKDNFTNRPLNDNVESFNTVKSEEVEFDFKEIEKSLLEDFLKNVKLDFNHLSRVLRKNDLDKCSKISEKIKNKYKPIYNIHSGIKKKIFSINNKFLNKNLNHDPSTILIKSLTLLKRRNPPNFAKFNPIHSGGATNNLNNSNGFINHSNLSESNEGMAPSIPTVIINDTANNLNNQTKNSENEKNDIQSEQEKVDYIDLQDKMTLEINQPNADKKKLKRKRISFIRDKELKKELRIFFNQENRKEIRNINTYSDAKFVDFYNFDIDEYYKGIELKYDAKNNKIDGKEIIKSTLDKLERYLQLKTFPKHMQLFLLNTIINAILTLRQSLLKWLLNQMLLISENPQATFNKNSNSLNSILMSFQISNTFFQSDFEPIINNSADSSEEEITKFLDFIDPLVDSPSRNIICEFCHRKGGRKSSGRLMFIRNENWAHINCIIWSKGVQETFDGNLFNVTQIMNKLKSFKCQFCKKYGATISCESKKCGKYYHFACAHAKQSVFTDKKQFYCGKCSNVISINREENFADFNTNKRYFIVKNSEFVNESKNNFNLDFQNSSNQFKIIPKYLIGVFNKYGNTTVLKFLQINQKDMNQETIDIAVVKYFEKHDTGKETNFDCLKSEKNSFRTVNPLQSQKNNKNLLLLLINEMGVYFSQLNFSKENSKEFEEFLDRTKIANCISKTEVDINNLRELSKSEILFKNFNGQYNLYLNKLSYPSLVNKERLDFYNSPIIKRFNSNLEEFIKSNVLTDEETEFSKRINKRYNDWLNVMNISIPFNIILKYGGLYLKTVTELSENMTVTSYQGDLTELKHKKESKSKLDNFINTIKSKNKIDDKLCFRFLNYLETHQQIKFVRKSMIENEMSLESAKSVDKRVNKVNKQTYKNLNRTMSTNIMEMDLPLAMKFRNYKTLRPRVTIGPSTIHRNGLFTTEAFQAGEIVIEYVGELITNKIADFREKEYNLKGFGDCYMFRLDGDHIIDATKYGNLARFINHCCDPNSSAQANQIGDKKHIILYAKRPIKANEEITYDYNFEAEQEKIQCRCGAKNCQGRLN